MSEVYDWRYENSINFTKEHINIEESDVKYSPWRTNSTLCNHIDTVLYSNEINMNSFLPHQLQFDYLYYIINKKKRYFKKEKSTNHSDFEVVQNYYKYNSVRIKEILKILTPEQIMIIKQKQEKGGVK